MSPNATGTDAPTIHQLKMMDVAVEARPPWMDEDKLSESLARLERHVKQVLTRRGRDAQDVERASWILPVVWKQLTPARWDTLMLAIRVHDGSPALFKLARSIGASKLAIDEGRAVRELVSAVREARASRRPARAAALLIVAARLCVAGRMDGADLLWTWKQVPEAIACAAAWAWSNPADSSLVQIADAHARANPRSPAFAWVALWQHPTATRWESYASSYTNWHHRPELRAEPGYALEHAKAWRELVEEGLPDGPARAVVEHHTEAWEPLVGAARRTRDRFLRVLLEVWMSRARDDSWEDKPYAEDDF